MKWKLKQEKSHKVFIIGPMYCEKCLTAYFLHKVRKDGPLDLYCDCGGSLWWLASFARRQNKRHNY